MSSFSEDQITVIKEEETSAPAPFSALKNEASVSIINKKFSYFSTFFFCFAQLLILCDL
jgi:hypothetical protein